MGFTPDTSRFVIGLDLDVPTFAYEKRLAAFTAEKYGLDINTLKPAHKWNYAECDGWPFKDEQEYRRTHREAVANGMFYDMDPTEGAAEAVNALMDEGFLIRVITSRFVGHGQYHRVTSDTTAALDRIGLRYNEICFVAHKTDVWADVYIDDGNHNIVPLRQMGRRVIVWDTPYNREVGGPAEDRHSDWDRVANRCREIRAERDAALAARAA